ncbi:MAG: hypothetical protein M0006_15700 [Magnetospirillum sp.]|nr:hypothetical protein [Magnetospirillum sp.]
MPMIEPNQLQPNPWNPNVLPDKILTALVNDLRQRKARGEHNPHPVLVADLDDELTIVDGEFTWRASVIAGLEQVHYELISGDGWELRRMTLVSNEHGKNDPVKFGRVIRGMLESRPDATLRDVAAAVNKSLGTVANRLEYAKLADMAKENPEFPSEAEISRLPVRKVRELIQHGPGGALGAAQALAEAGEPSEASADPNSPISQAKRVYQQMPPAQRREFLSWAVQEAKRQGVSAPKAPTDGAGAAGEHRDPATPAPSPSPAPSPGTSGQDEQSEPQEPVTA